ncbi:MAG TPA: ATP-binding protein [Ignavibacteria bacterium]
MKYINRVLEETLKKHIKIFSAVGVTGPRQSGKSTMLLNMFKDKYEYISFDDINNIEYFHRDPEGFMNRYNDKIIFDEVQYVPEIFNYIKILIDKRREKRGKFIITGSSQFAFVQKITESLAGRIGLLTLLPFQYSEIPDKYKKASMYRGSYPELSFLKYRNTDLWYSSYINTYLEKDVRNISNIGDLRDFLSFIKLLGARVSQILNLSEISKEIGIAVSTAKRWISILEASYIIFLLPPYHSNIGKRIIKSPKIYFFDTGLPVYLMGLYNTNIEKTHVAGPLFENYIISEFLKKEIHKKSNSGFYYLRTSNGVEADLIITKAGKRHFYEIKGSSTFKSNMLKGIESLKSKNEPASLIYKGKDFSYGDTLNILNYSTILK